MLIITDEDVPDSVADFLEKRGHEVLRARDHFVLGSPDVLIAAAASEQRAVVVTWNRRHFRALAKRRRRNGELTYAGMGVILFRCSEARGRDRLESVIDEVEEIFRIRTGGRGTRMIIEIAESVLRVED